MGGGPVWVPLELVDANYTLPFPSGSGCFQANTNGLASGNHRLEASATACARWWSATPQLSGGSRPPAHATCRTSSVTAQEFPRLRPLAEADSRCESGTRPGTWASRRLGCLVADGGQIADPDRRRLPSDARDRAPARPHRGGAVPPHLAFPVPATTCRSMHGEPTYRRRRHEMSTCDLDNRGLAVGVLGRACPPSPRRRGRRKTCDWLLERLRAAGIDAGDQQSTWSKEVELSLPVVRIVVPGLEGPYDEDSGGSTQENSGPSSLR